MSSTRAQETSSQAVSPVARADGVPVRRGTRDHLAGVGGVRLGTPVDGTATVARRLVQLTVEWDTSQPPEPPLKSFAQVDWTG
jgi:hypothetical protein